MIVDNGTSNTGGISLSLSNDDMIALVNYTMLDENIRNVFMDHLGLNRGLLTDRDHLMDGYADLQGDGLMEVDYTGLPKFVDLDEDSPLVYWMLITLGTVLASLQSVVDIKIMLGRTINNMIMVSNDTTWFALWLSKNDMVSMVGGFSRDNMSATMWSKLSRFVDITGNTKTRNLTISFARYDGRNKELLGTALFGGLPIFNEVIPTNTLLALRDPDVGSAMIEGMYTYSSYDDVRNRIRRVIEVV